MVYQKIDQRAPMTIRKTGTGLFLTILFILIITLGVCLGLIMFDVRNETTPAAPTSNEISGETTSENIDDVIEDEIKPKEIDFQPVIDEWIKTTSGTRSVILYDLDLDKVAGAYNADKQYNTASLYKLFVVYEGYRRVQSGEWSGDAGLIGGRTILTCLDLAIRESNSECAEAIWAKIGHANLDEIIKNDFKITDSDISSLISTPSDMVKMLKIYFYHDDITNSDLVDTMKDSFLNQPTTEYNWRQGLPSGFKLANVYNKVGWDYDPDNKYWKLYHDAAIVEFPEQNRNFIIVVMSSRVPFQKIRQLGGMIEDYFNKY